MQVLALRERRAVSPVIGIVLMVGVTVILAAVIGTFVLGVGTGITTDTPKVAVEFDFSGGGNGFKPSDGNDEVTVAHTGGDSIDGETLTVVVGSQETSSGVPSTFASGKTVTVDESGPIAMASGDEVKLVWEKESGGASAVLASETVP